MKTKRNLSGVFFKVKNKETKKYEYRCFEDLSDEQQDKIMKQRSSDWLMSLISVLAETINVIGDHCDLYKEP